MNRDPVTTLLQMFTDLADSLRLTNKGGTADYFIGLRERLAGAASPADLQSLLEEIRPIRGIADYAGFSGAQSLMLTKVLKEVSVIEEQNGWR